MTRLGVALSAIGGRTRRRRRYRSAIAEARRWQTAYERVVALNVRLENEIRRDRDERAESERSLTVEIDKLRAENDILNARDAMWVAWETRERERINAETARLAAAKTRSVEMPLEVNRDAEL